MGKLSLVLADVDTEYLSKLEKYLIVNYPQRFEIISFASREKLDLFLAGTDKVDLLLISSDMFIIGPMTAGTAKTIILDGGGASPVPAGYDTIEKYQHAGRLVAELLRLYTARGIKDHTMPGKYRTSIISVCSPAGGAGKSSIAAGCSILYESRGSRAFYLNLEAIPSTEMFFHSEAGSGQSFSNAIYHLKGKNSNTGLKLEGASSMDARTGVHYFRPPENLLEFNELAGQDITLLLDTFRKSAVYDMVFIDTASGFSPVNTEVIMQSDGILLILEPGQGTSVKYKEFMNTLGYIKGRHGDGPAGTIIPVLNRLGGTDPDAVMPGLFTECRPVAVVKECPIPTSGDFPSVLTENVSFLSDISSLCGYITPVRAAAASAGGGESIAS